MAVRQYIGARYVPIYAGNWDAAKNYEPLTIVTDANGNSFTSMKDVPAGTALTDRNYWIQTSSFSAAVDALQRRVGNLDDKTDQTNLNLDRTNLELNALEDEVEAMRTAQARYIVISDSYGAVPASRNFVDMMKSKLSLSDTNFYNISQNGYGLNPPYGEGQNKFINLLRNATITDETTITHIVIAGGFNDRGQTFDKIISAVAEIISYIKTRFTRANIYFAAIGWSFNSEYVAECNGGKWIDAWKKCIAYGAHYLNGTEYIMRNKSLFEEEPATNLYLGYTYVHPNADGAAALCNGIIEAINRGSTTPSYFEKDINVDINTAMISQVSGEPLSFIEKMDSGITTILKKGFELTSIYPVADITVPASTRIMLDVGMLRSGVIAGATPGSEIIAAGSARGFIHVKNVGNVFTIFTPIFVNNRLYLNIGTDAGAVIDAICLYTLEMTVNSNMV